MKKLITTLVITALFTIGAMAQWSTSGDIVYLTSSNDSVGMGTSSPEHKLDVLGSIAANYVYIEHSGESGGGVIFGREITDYFYIFKYDNDIYFTAKSQTPLLTLDGDDQQVLIDGVTILDNRLTVTGATVFETYVTIEECIKLTPTVSPPNNPVKGWIYMDTDGHMYCYNGIAWKQLDN